MKTQTVTTVLAAFACLIAVSLLIASAAIAADPAAKRRETVVAQAETRGASGSEKAVEGKRGAERAQPGGVGGAIRGGGGGGTFGSGGGFVGPRGSFSFSSQFAAYDRPAIVVTQPMSVQTQTEWKEDLTVMDKLLGDEIIRVSGETAPQAMGIRLTMFGHAAPMYLEGCGAVFSSTVNLPLAAADKGTAKPNERPAGSASAWDRAKSAIAASSRNADGSQVVSGRAMFPPIKFDQGKVDELVSAILKVLPEAKNIRHLKDDEFVMVTIAGFDEAGVPVRLTLKVKKSDIDGAASGKLAPPDFKARVALRIG